MQYQMRLGNALSNLHTVCSTGRLSNFDRQTLTVKGLNRNANKACHNGSDSRSSTTLPTLTTCTFVWNGSRVYSKLHNSTTRQPGSEPGFYSNRIFPLQRFDVLTADSEVAPGP